MFYALHAIAISRKNYTLKNRGSFYSILIPAFLLYFILYILHHSAYRFFLWNYFGYFKIFTLPENPSENAFRSTKGYWTALWQIKGWWKCFAQSYPLLIKTVFYVASKWMMQYFSGGFFVDGNGTANNRLFSILFCMVEWNINQNFRTTRALKSNFFKPFFRKYNYI
jgi:hypothetical protein